MGRGKTGYPRAGKAIPSVKCSSMQATEPKVGFKYLPIKNKQKLYVFFRSHFMVVECFFFFAGVTDCINGYEFHFENAHEWNIVSEWGLVCRYVKDKHVT